MDQSGSYPLHGQDLAADTASALLRELVTPPAGWVPIEIETQGYRAAGWFELVVIGLIYFASIGLAVWQVAGLAASPTRPTLNAQATGHRDTRG